MALLGAILHNNRAYEQVSEFLRAEHFANRVHGRIFAAMASKIDRAEVADPITLKLMFEADGDSAEVGGFAYLMRLAGSVASALNSRDYARTIVDAYRCRLMILLGDDLRQAGFRQTMDFDVGAGMAAIETRLTEITGAGQIDSNRGLKHVKVAGDAYMERVESAARADPGEILGISTGVRELDQKLGGLQGETLYIVGGRPSMCKTVFGLQIAEVDAAAGGRPALFSLEMSREQIIQRLAARATGISMERQLRPGLSPANLEALVQFRAALDDLPLHIDDSAGLTLAQIRSECRRLKRSGGITSVVVDYLQIVSVDDRDRSGSGHQDMRPITRGLKSLAKELGVPVVVLSQLTRALEARDDKRPQMADLRESGSIEEDSDVIIFPFREEYYMDRSVPEKGERESFDKFNSRKADWEAHRAIVRNKIEFGIAKNRQGPIGKVVSHVDLVTQRIGSLIEMQSGASLFGQPDGRPSPPPSAYEELGF